MATRAPARTKDHRAALLDAAIECVQEKGYARTTARDIVAAAGSHLPSINYYFGSKEALLNEALAELCRRWLASLDELAAASAGMDLFERLQAFAGSGFAVLEENRGATAAFWESLAQTQRSDELREQVADHYNEYRLTVAKLVDELAPGVEDRETLASLLIAVSDGLMLQWFLDPERTPSADALVRALRAAAGLG